MTLISNCCGAVVLGEYFTVDSPSKHEGFCSKCKESAEFIMEEIFEMRQKYWKINFFPRITCHGGKVVIIMASNEEDAIKKLCSEFKVETINSVVITTEIEYNSYIENQKRQQKAEDNYSRWNSLVKKYSKSK